MSVEELNLLIDTDCLNPRLIALIKDGQILKSQAYIQNNHLIPGAIRRHLGEGVTLSVRALHETNPAIAAFCRQLADELGHPTQANCYLTPSGHQGFAHHWDPHITVIIQISGKKTWDLYAPMIPDPVYPQLAWTTVGFTDTQRQYLESHDPDYSITLLPGDVLWIPRGWIHNPYAPEAGAEPSLHLTIGIVQRTFHWVATRLLEEAIHDPRFRRALPPCGAIPAPEKLGETWELLASWFGSLDLTQAAADLDAATDPDLGLALPAARSAPSGLVTFPAATSLGD